MADNGTIVAHSAVGRLVVELEIGRQAVDESKFAQFGDLGTLLIHDLGCEFAKFFTKL